MNLGDEERVTSWIHRAAAAALALSSLSFTSSARAAGLLFPDRGVRPVARGGAFVAGADDPGAIAYNPAGLFDAAGQFLVDGSWVQFSADYTRRTLVRQVDPNSGETVSTSVLTSPEVSGSTPFLPIPTIAAAIGLTPKMALGLGVYAPYGALASYPEDVNGEPAPQRYQLYSLEGSALAFLNASLAIAPSDEWRFGASLELLVGNVNARVAMSGCVPDRFVCAQEDPDWDVIADASIAPIISPTGQIGAQWIPTPDWHVGLSFHLPVWIRAGGTVKNRLPATPVFEQARQEGEDVDVALDLPWTLRLGVETRAVEDLRVEVGFAWEHWSMHDTVTVDPDGLALRDVAGFPDPFYIPTIDIPRNFQDAVSFRAGGEYDFQAAKQRFTARGGLSFETSAVPEEYVSALTVDAPKVTAALGVGLHLGKVRLDATFAHVFFFDVDLAPEDARMAPVSPVQANPPENPTYINGGTYSASANVIGLGLAYTFGDPPAQAQAPAQVQVQAK